MRIAFLIVFLFSLSNVWSRPSERIEIQKVVNNIYALVGQRGPMSKWNYGTNATFGVVITDAGVVLIDSGASYLAAKEIHRKIKQITDKPVVMVINTGSEDLRWLGNSYFKSLGVKIITGKVALKDQRERAGSLINRLDEYIFPKFSVGTEDVYADEIFEKEKMFIVGNTEFVLHYTGPAYLPGDFTVWMPKQKVVFSGDIISTERMLAVSRDSNTASWLKSFEYINSLKPEYVVPGHGHATNMEKARADTYEFLSLLRSSVKAFINKGGQIEDVSSLKEYPLSPYERLIGYEMLLGRNALHVYMELEWD
ncbi:hypothetical protein MNBD_GAMMA23-840 [hydrothermal vent metagenome]|uniref:Metallo-beta-lactamase domain-containing protein n=1 Tax=hydrothermal vent metagenome TaxID=652676 RepID=A0A3B0ZYQ9_9ZZZZ